MPLTPNTITICATARLVRGVLAQHQQQQLKSGATQWQSAQAYTLQQWLDELINHASLLGFIPSDALPTLTLSTIAETYLWEQAIETCIAKHEAAELFDIRSMAKSAIEANNLMLNWQLAEADINHDFITQETRQFLRWRHTFEDFCAKQNAIESARLTSLQIVLFAQFQQQIIHELALPKHIQLAGFDRITPLEARLFELLKGCGVQVEMMTTHTQGQTEVKHFAAVDANSECRAAVAWAKQKLTENPKAQLAIISPALGSIRRELADLLDDTFHSETLHSSLYETPRCYDFSLGLALTEYAIVHSALQLLRLAASKADLIFDEVTPLLQDVYWGSQQELDARAQLDAHLRRNMSASYHLESLIKQASKLQTNGILLDELLENLTQISRFQNQQGKQRQVLSAWVTDFVQLLDELHWAKTRSLSSHEFQTQQAFLKCLKELSSLDAIFGNVSASAAVQKITELCNATMFQSEAKGDIRIQILGLLETPAVQLDAVWALNMNDQHWPPAVKLNPLLPADLQRNRGTPNASAAVQSQFASLVHQRLMTCAPEVIFSYATKEDERELRPSPLLEIQSDLQTPSTIQTLTERLAQPASLQFLDDFIAPAVLPDENIRGGVNLFAAQAKCPAWAFYQYRLGAAKLETPVDGLDTMSRGSLLHKVLQLFWLDCETLSNLKALFPPLLNEKIDTAIEKSIQALSDEINYHIPPQVLQIERNRLHQLMQAWLTLELERADFVVDACEKKFELDVEGLKLNLSIDRIDKLAEGGLVVIDYKTSAAVSNSSWAEDRISEPQLPIYVVLALKYEQVVAVSFAKIRSDETKFIGLSAERDVLPKVTALAKVRENSAFYGFGDWDALLEHWYTSLTNIAQEIKAGVAGVTISNEADLVYCDVKPLLRLPERLLQFEHMQVVLRNGGDA
ncbi:PD-(D/E)XK nuclease family protein [Methylotenera versatilis]|uniref:Putative DNA repair protein n=1 Tax=Methylotenera versatilis (strain 301) TaxID=666681 RepID=D7DJ23_METV0|nr:PD-(D/E)XK nuclease family protein [Methylotenera versatilis]ADI30058.1 putative DNA repair protein [Methylotenera versatilis 301]